jgi:hypothetical protein
MAEIHPQKKTLIGPRNQLFHKGFSKDWFSREYDPDARVSHKQDQCRTARFAIQGNSLGIMIVPSRQKTGFQEFSINKREKIQRDAPLTTNERNEKNPTRKILTEYARSYKQTYNIERFHF